MKKRKAVKFGYINRTAIIAIAVIRHDWVKKIERTNRKRKKQNCFLKRSMERRDDGYIQQSRVR